MFRSELPCYDLIVPALLKGDIDGLKEACKLTPGTNIFLVLNRFHNNVNPFNITNMYLINDIGIPLKPMLAHPTKALTDILDRFENIAFTCNFSFDIFLISNEAVKTSHQYLYKCDVLI